MILTFALYAVTAAGQSECKVLLPALSGSYEGGCRKGLADGDGVAIGTDTYKGSFKKACRTAKVHIPGQREPSIPGNGRKE